MDYLDKINEISEAESLTAGEKENVKFQYSTTLTTYDQVKKEMKKELEVKFANDLNLFSQQKENLQLTKDGSNYVLSFSNSGVKLSLTQMSRKIDLFEKYSINIIRGEKKYNLELTLKPKLSRVHRPTFENRETWINNTPNERLTSTHINTLKEETEKLKAEIEVFENASKPIYEITKDGIEKFNGKDIDQDINIYIELLKQSGLFSEIEG
ncbi:hypothetical protein [Acinetobacter sp. TUM15131]|uniref:hypothetical protein n=1 Tax=Acinetobacter sp. TUM15131 TaxID=2609141 RepID=UPI00124EA9E3|nr:hypothetical protein [Acinetobacter sp. TUM15131]